MSNIKSIAGMVNVVLPSLTFGGPSSLSIVIQCLCNHSFTLKKKKQIKLGVCVHGILLLLKTGIIKITLNIIILFICVEDRP